MTVKLADLTDAQIGKFRHSLPDSAWRLKHDCLVAVGCKRSPHRGGKAEARRRVVDAMNETGNADSVGDSCTCGHAIEEHGHDPEYPGSTACSECPDVCIAYEANR